MCLILGIGGQEENQWEKSRHLSGPDVAEKVFEVAIINIFRELMKSVLIMSKQMQTLSRKMETKNRTK